jgi:hypothetical protein
MLRDIISVKHIENYRLEITFEDGVSGTVDIGKMIPFTGIFSSLKDEKEFAKVFVNSDTGTIEWPNGADIDPVVLYSVVTGKEIEMAASPANV